MGGDFCQPTLAIHSTPPASMTAAAHPVGSLDSQVQRVFLLQDNAIPQINTRVICANIRALFQI
jgi:hypothetical protein